MNAIKNKKKKKNTLKSKVRIFISLVVFGSITASLLYNCAYNVMKIFELKQEELRLKDEQITLDSEHDILEKDIQRLNDKNYIAKYVREKYLYSKDGELILRIDD